MLYNTYRNYLTKKFGQPVLRVPISAGFSCPNRDGSLDTTGCLFCDNRSFSPAAESVESALEQLKNAIASAGLRYKAFIPYLQPFSNTYAPVETLRAIYEPLIQILGVVGLAIGTRPDCLPPDTIAYLADLSKRTDLLIELGLQSSHDRVLHAINRGHTRETFVKAVHDLHTHHIAIATHIMIGFPGETDAMLQETAQLLASLPIEGIKIHQLMIIAGTGFESLYHQGLLMPLSIETYAEKLGLILQNLRPDQHIHRIMAEASIEHGLIAPLWSTDKTTSTNIIRNILSSKGFRQGCAQP